ncbi:MAG TPA: thiamine pyrophosphate-dependent enzyme [Pirellulales bacterium]|jgi:indolepyruvate decarboxylase|nr:thiamine pyrophosphate-dependent enzyme [Pirellulales bacterium]
MTKGTEAAPGSQSITGLSIGAYIIRRLQDYGVRHVFGIPGDYVLGFYKMLSESPIQTLNCTREDCAGFAADAYARVNGMGAVCVTYCVGGLSLCNSIAGAYAEKSPVVVISGAPGLGERINNPLLHHKVRDFHTQSEVFEKLCIAGAELDDTNEAFREIDRVLDAAARHKRPVYLELPRDMVGVVPEKPHQFRQAEAVSNQEALNESVEEAVSWISSCRKAVIIAGVEIHRFGLQDDVLALAEKSNIAVAATMLGKSVVSEVHPLYVGLYEGALGREEVTRFVEESDCVILLGTFMTDINLGIYTANLNPAKCVYATSEQLRIRHHHFHGVQLGDFIRALAARHPTPPQRVLPPNPKLNSEHFSVRVDAPITIRRLTERLNQMLNDQTVVIADIGDSLFAATELIVRERTEFISPAYYTSMGFAVPAALGVHVARADRRAVVIVGDGAFQMTGMELSTLVRYRFPTIIVLLDNGGYGTERFLHPQCNFNDVHPWRYHKLPEALGGGTGYEVRTEGELDEALKRAWADTSGPSLIQVHIDTGDISTALRRLSERLSKRV